MKSNERERRDWVIFLLILLIGIVLMLCAGQSAVAMLPRWSVQADVNSNLNPDDSYAKQHLAIIEPVKQEILTPPAWKDSILTPQAAVTGTAIVIPMGVFGTETRIPTEESSPTISSTVSTSLPTVTAVTTSTNPPTLTRTATPTKTTTITQTSSVTQTRTSTRTYTLTYTNTRTNTATVTRTNTPSPTRTFTRTYTNTATRTSTNTVFATNTRTNTPGLPPTSTRTPISPPASTSTHTSTPVNTPTSTYTLTPTNTPDPSTATPTATPIPPTDTHTPTATFTPSNTPTSTLTPTPACSNDLYEPDNSYSQAQAITTDGVQQYHLNTSPVSEEDWVVFNAIAGHTYEIRTQLINDISSGDNAANDTLLYLYDTNGTTQLAFNDDVGNINWYMGAYFYRESIITWTAPANGSYYVRELQWGPTVPYTIRDCHAYYLWVEDISNPAIDLEKDISLDGGTTWQDADSAPGLDLLFGTDPRFRFSVTNMGNVPLTGIKLEDPGLSAFYQADLSTSCAIPATLSAGGSFVCYGTLPWLLGPQTNTATVTADFDSISLSDVDVANYVGIDPGYKMCDFSSTTDASGTIKDTGGGAYDYSNNEDCTFLISPGYPPSSITLTFSSFNSELGYDELRIYDGTNSSGTLLGTFAGTSLPGEVTADSGSMFLRFTSDGSDTAPGFIATWDTTITPTDYSMCTDTGSSNVAGSLSDSGGVNSNYLDNEICSFLIQPGVGSSTVTLSFSQFNTENSSGTDLLSVYDGINATTGTLLGAFWGVTKPANLTAYSGSMYIEWTSDVSNTYPGYIASWTSEVYFPSLELTKSANVPIVYSSGDVILYTFSAQNMGNVPLSNLVLSDPLLGSGLDCTTISNLLPGASQTFSCLGNNYIVTQDDLDNRVAIGNTATVSGTAPDSSVISASDSEIVAITQNPAITVVKEVSPDSGANWFDANSAPGSYLSVTTINPRFRFTVMNTGNVTLKSIVLSDPKVSGFFKSNFTTPCTPPSTLVPGDNFTCYAELSWAPGQQSNTATASGEFKLTLYSDTDTAYYFGSTPKIVLSKSAIPSSISAAGEAITYSFSVQNMGDAPLSNITVDDLMLSGLSCATINDLQPGTSQPFDCTAGNTYAVTQADLDLGVDIENTATVEGYAPDGFMVSDSASVAVLISQTPELTLTKSADRTNIVAADEVITYSFSVQNTGNVTIEGIALTDALLTGLSCDTVASLLPGVSYSFTCSGNTYKVTQADLLSGDVYIVNTATVSGTPPVGGPISDSDSIAIYFLPAPTPNPLIQMGNPDGTFVIVPDNQILYLDLGTPLYALSTPDGYPDIVYFERNNGTSDQISMDQVLIELGDYFLNIWYRIFYWGDGIPDTNSNLNILTPAVGGSEADNQIIYQSLVPLYGTSPLNTGITIDIDGFVPAATPYQWLRISVPTGGAGDGADIDSILVLYKTPTPTPLLSTPFMFGAPPLDTPVPTLMLPPTIVPTSTPEPSTPEPTTSFP